ncbi:MAG: septum formation protein [Alphaproteobacteria bacterium]|jgi:septum formation protein
MWSLPVVLASASPRRRELIAYIADKLSFDSANIDETPLYNESAYDLVERLALSKAQYVATRHANALVIGSDTVIGINDIILGKPIDFNDFARMMALLSNTQHQVYTGVCVVNTATKRIVKQVLTTHVNMGEISSQNTFDYWQTGEPQDKAGGYAIQGIGGKYVKSINGSISAVIGLPIYETKQLLIQATE